MEKVLKVLNGIVLVIDEVLGGCLVRLEGSYDLQIDYLGSRSSIYLWYVVVTYHRWSSQIYLVTAWRGLTCRLGTIQSVTLLGTLVQSNTAALQ